MNAEIVNAQLVVFEESGNSLFLEETQKFTKRTDKTCGKMSGIKF